jgi:NADPH:quinone reductase-like Zn-dependent oxidoreductase
MRAIVQNEFGGPEVLTLVERPSPVAGAGEVVVEVRAAGINPVDVAVRSGQYRLLGEPPFTIGWDISGVVKAAGAGADFKVGDEVFGMPRFPEEAAAYAEEVVAPAAELARKPARLDHVRAAALPLAGLTAWQALVGAAGVKAGDRVLIHAGAGGVGHLAVQIAKALGAHVLTTVSRGKIDFVRGLGADEAIDYDAADFAGAARDVDIVLETIGGEHSQRSLATLRPGGILVSLRDHGNADLAARASDRGLRFEAISVRPDRQGLVELGRLAEAGKLDVHVERTFPLAKAGEAHAFLGTHPKGKLALTT